MYPRSSIFCTDAFSAAANAASQVVSVLQPWPQKSPTQKSAQLAPLHDDPHAVPVHARAQLLPAQPFPQLSPRQWLAHVCVVHVGTQSSLLSTCPLPVFATGAPGKELILTNPFDSDEISAHGGFLGPHGPVPFLPVRRFVSFGSAQFGKLIRSCSLKFSPQLASKQAQYCHPIRL